MSIYVACFYYNPRVWIQLATSLFSMSHVNSDQPWRRAGQMNALLFVTMQVQLQWDSSNLEWLFEGQGSVQGRVPPKNWIITKHLFLGPPLNLSKRLIWPFRMRVVDDFYLARVTQLPGLKRVKGDAASQMFRQTCIFLFFSCRSEGFCWLKFHVLYNLWICRSKLTSVFGISLTSVDGVSMENLNQNYLPRRAWNLFFIAKPLLVLIYPSGN